MTTEQITFKDITLIVQGYYEEGEDEVRYDSDMGGYSGSPSDFHIEFIFVEVLGATQGFLLEVILN